VFFKKTNFDKNLDFKQNKNSKKQGLTEFIRDTFDSSKQNRVFGQNLL